MANFVVSASRSVMNSLLMMIWGGGGGGGGGSSPRCDYWCVMSCSKPGGCRDPPTRSKPSGVPCQLSQETQRSRLACGERSVAHS